MIQRCASVVVRWDVWNASLWGVKSGCHIIWQMQQVLVSAIENQCLDKVSVSLRSGILFIRKSERAKEKSARKALSVIL